MFWQISVFFYIYHEQVLSNKSEKDFNFLQFVLFLITYFDLQ